VNQNQGAESTLAFLLALAEMRRTQNAVSALGAPKVAKLKIFGKVGETMRSALFLFNEFRSCAPIMNSLRRQLPKWSS
jgi:hypothetical protein